MASMFNISPLLNLKVSLSLLSTGFDDSVMFFIAVIDSVSFDVKYEFVVDCYLAGSTKAAILFPSPLRVFDTTLTD